MSKGWGEIVGCQVFDHALYRAPYRSTSTVATCAPSGASIVILVRAVFVLCILILYVFGSFEALGERNFRVSFRELALTLL